jgi:hypothetical protein
MISRVARRTVHVAFIRHIPDSSGSRSIALWLVDRRRSCATLAQIASPTAELVAHAAKERGLDTPSTILKWNLPPVDAEVLRDRHLSSLDPTMRFPEISDTSADHECLLVLALIEGHSEPECLVPAVPEEIQERGTAFNIPASTILRHAATHTAMLPFPFSHGYCSVTTRPGLHRHAMFAAVFHGTSCKNAMGILESDSLRPSERGMLGPGVYGGPFSKAARFAMFGGKTEGTARDSHGEPRVALKSLDDHPVDETPAVVMMLLPTGAPLRHDVITQAEADDPHRLQCGTAGFCDVCDRDRRGRSTNARKRRVVDHYGHKRAAMEMLSVTAESGILWSGRKRISSSFEMVCGDPSATLIIGASPLIGTAHGFFSGGWTHEDLASPGSSFRPQRVWLGQRVIRGL